ncbi:MAG: glucose-1-phosphate adenylyltransferase [Acidimicrobiales bacterium]
MAYNPVGAHSEIGHPPEVLAMVLAGGAGKRLGPLTADRAKPAVPFAGSYRLIDFVLSNLVNSGYRKIVVLTQYKSHSLNRHINQTWSLSPLLGNYVATVPAQMRYGPQWYAGSADAIFQNLNLIHDERPECVAVFGADHVYRIDATQMVQHHLASGKAVTVAAVRVPVSQACSFGVIEANNGIISRFIEKPATAVPIPGTDQVFASMGNYVFSTSALVEAVTRDAADETSGHDVGGDLIPSLVERGEAAVYDFSTNVVPGATERDWGYWRDVGTLDSYYSAHMDLISVHPVFNLYNMHWPFFSWHRPLPPAKFVFDEDGRRGQALESMVGDGVIISGGTVRRSVLSPGVVVHTGALVEDSVLLDDVEVGGGAVVQRAILDKQVYVPPASGVGLGVGKGEDCSRFVVSPGGITVLGKMQPVHARPGCS